MTQLLDDYLRTFSVQNSEFILTEQEGVQYIQKVIQPKILNQEKLPQLYGFMLEYITVLQRTGIPLPKISSHAQEENTLRFTCRYEGPNLQQLLQNQEATLLTTHFAPLLSQIISIFQLAQAQNISLDPHPKNFVVNKHQQVHYVDFSPPLLPQYAVLLLASLDHRLREPIEKNLACFEPQNLGYHFAADLIKSSPRFYSILPELYQLFSAGGIIQGSLEEFHQRAEEIKSIELARAALNAPFL